MALAKMNIFSRHEQRTKQTYEKLHASTPYEFLVHVIFLAVG